MTKIWKLRNVENYKNVWTTTRQYIHSTAPPKPVLRPKKHMPTTASITAPIPKNIHLYMPQDQKKTLSMTIDLTPKKIAGMISILNTKVGVMKT